MQYVITFVGKISWEGRTNGLPEEIYAFILYDSEGAPDAAVETLTINKLIEEQMGRFLKAQGMFVQRDQGQTIDVRVTPQDRIYVPFRWIVSTHVTLKPIVGELSEADESGIERFKNGELPLTN